MKNKIWIYRIINKRYLKLNFYNLIYSNKRKHKIDSEKERDGEREKGEIRKREKREREERDK